MLTMTVLPPMPLALVALLTALLMAANSGRMIVAMTMINACVDPRRRGSFMSLSSSVQHLASGCGAFASGQILGLGAERELTHYGIVGALAACTALGSILLMSGLRPTSTAAEPAETSSEEDLGLALCADSQSVATGRQSAA
jgi:DHA1 family inner membrane transport protein